MNRIFNIVWFEDTPDWLKAAKRNVEEVLKDLYLEPHITEHRSGDTFDIRLFDNQVDLILMDYALVGTINKGDQIISLIRQTDFLTDILFYSSDEGKLNSSVRESIPDVDGIYISKRDISLFTVKVEKLIKKIVHRSENIENLRGYVLDASAEFEAKAKDFVSDLWKNGDSSRQQKLKDIVNTQILDNYKSFVDDIKTEFQQGSLDLIRLNEKKMLLTMNNRLSIIDLLAEKENNDQAKIEGKSIRDFYMEKLGYFRNKLGHVSVGDKINVNGQTYEVNAEFFQMIRKNIYEMQSPFVNALNEIK